MRRIAGILLLIPCAVMFLTLAARADVIVQNPGTDYLVVEAELFSIDDRNNEATGWLVIGPDSPQEVELFSDNPGFITVPPKSSNASGGLAIFDQVGGGDFVDQVGWELQFAEPGVYYLYGRYSMFDLRNLVSDGYGNEDSIYIPYETIDEDPTEQYLRDSRLGNVGLNRDPYGTGVQILPSDGCRIGEEPWILPEEECETIAEQFEGQYHWQPFNWPGEEGQANYVIDQVGSVLDFAIATRERGTSLDVLVLSQRDDLTTEELNALINVGGKRGDFNGNGILDAGDIDDLTGQSAGGTNPPKYDLTGDGLVNADDVTEWITADDLFYSWPGDADLDGEFKSDDLIAVLAASTYETGTPSVWSTGDFNGDGFTTSNDLIDALAGEGYEAGARTDVASVPEPSALALLTLGALFSVRRLRRRD